MLCLFCVFLLSVVDFYFVTSFFWEFKVHILMQSESLTRTNCTMDINNHEHYPETMRIILKNSSLWCAGIVSDWYLFCIQIWSLKDEIMIMSLFIWSLSYSIHSPFNSPHPHSLQKFFPSRVSFPSICALKIVSSFVHWGKWERVALLGGMGGAQVIIGVKIFVEQVFLISKPMFHPYWVFAIALEITKKYMACLLSALFLSLYVFIALLASRPQKSK